MDSAGSSPVSATLICLKWSWQSLWSDSFLGILCFRPLKAGEKFYFRQRLWNLTWFGHRSWFCLLWYHLSQPCRHWIDSASESRSTSELHFGWPFSCRMYPGWSIFMNFINYTSSSADFGLCSKCSSYSISSQSAVEKRNCWSTHYSSPIAPNSSKSAFARSPHLISFGYWSSDLTWILVFCRSRSTS